MHAEWPITTPAGSYPLNKNTFDYEILSLCVKLAGCPLGGGPFLIHRILLSVKNPAALQFLTQTGVPGTQYHTLFKRTSIFCLAYSSSEWHTYTIHVSVV